MPGIDFRLGSRLGKNRFDILRPKELLKKRLFSGNIWTTYGSRIVTITKDTKV